MNTKKTQAAKRVESRELVGSKGDFKLWRRTPKEHSHREVDLLWVDIERKDGTLLTMPEAVFRILFDARPGGEWSPDGYYGDTGVTYVYVPNGPQTFIVAAYVDAPAATIHVPTNVMQGLREAFVRNETPQGAPSVA